jgi:hypothetical protein
VYALLLPQTLSLNSFFVEQRFDADPARSRAEMPAQSVGTGITAATPPQAAFFKLSFANELLLCCVKSFVALFIVLARKAFPAHFTQEWALLGVGAKMRVKVISANKSFRAQSTLEGRGMFRNPLGVSTVCIFTG